MWPPLPLEKSWLRPWKLISIDASSTKRWPKKKNVNHKHREGGLTSSLRAVLDYFGRHIENCVANKELRFILGVDFNVTLDSDHDCSGGRPFKKRVSRHLADTKPWKEASYMKTKSPFIQRRLDYILLVNQQRFLRRDREVWHYHSAILLQLIG